MGASELARLDAGHLSDEQLEHAYQAAVKLDAGELAAHFAGHLIGRPPRPEQPSRVTAGATLARGVAGRSRIGAGVPFLDRDPDQPIFRFLQGGYLRGLLADAMTKAKLSFPRRQRGFHLFCHTYGTWMMRFGNLDNFGLTRTGRWKDPRSAEGYLHTVVNSEAKMADVLPTPKR